MDNCELSRLVTQNVLTNLYWERFLEENTSLVYSVENIAKMVEKAVIRNSTVVCILSELHMFLNSRTVTSEYSVTTSCENSLNPALSSNGNHRDVTQTQLVMDAESAILFRIVPRYIRYLW